MPNTVIDHEWGSNWNQEVDNVRKVGEVRGVSVECWRSKVSGKIALVVLPTVRGFDVLAIGDLAEIDVFANVGRAVLQAMAGVIPLVTGDFFAAPMGQAGMPASGHQ